MEQEIIPHGAPRGRPLRMTRAIEDEINRRIALGESLIEICDDDHMPARSTVYDWLMDERSGDFADRYTRAREHQADTMFDEIKLISDEGRNDYMERRNEAGVVTGYEVNGEHIQRSKLRIEARRWMAGKLRPKKYGDKLDLTTGGEAINHDPGDVAAKAAALLATARKRKGG